MSKHDYPSVDYIKQALRYEDGKLFWLHRPQEHFSSFRSYRTWNATYEGKEAGCLSNGDRWGLSLDSMKILRCRMVWLIHNGSLPDRVLHKDNDLRNDRIENLIPYTYDNIVTCTNCQKKFYRPPANQVGNGRRGTNNYCSRECMAEAFVGHKSPRKGIWITKLCVQCGSLVERPMWFHKKTEERNGMVFCDPTCFGDWKSENWRGENNPVWSGGKDYYYGTNWEYQSRKARIRDQRKCQFCHKHTSSGRRNLDVHHIRPFRFFGLARYKEANQLSNLVSLCERCHHCLERFCVDGAITDWTSLLVAALATPEGRQRACPDVVALVARR